MPRVAVDNGVDSVNGGRVIVSWYDTRNTGGNSAEIFAATLGNNGATIGKNVQLGTSPVSGAPGSSSTGLGDYTGLDFENGSFYPLWADNNTLGGKNDGI